MPVEAKPLFRPDVLRAHLAGFQLPPHVAALRPKLAHWADLIASGRIDSFNEQQLLPDFLTDFFVHLLGYTRPADGGDRYTINREQHVEVDGKFADAVLGDFHAAAPSPSSGGFQPPSASRAQRPEISPLPAAGEGPGVRGRASELSRGSGEQVINRPSDSARSGGFQPPSAPRYIVALEGKGPRDPLDRPFAGRRMSAVDQGYRYAINLPCDWIIVTSLRETRLYHKGSNQQTYERFETERLADDEALLRRFLFLLGAERVVPAAGECHFKSLLAESERVGRELTREFYINYANMRQDERCCTLGRERYELQTAVQRRLIKTFGEAPNGDSLGTLNQKAQVWWDQTPNELGAALKTSFKLPSNPFRNPRTADEWEPYLVERRAEVKRIAQALADAEAEINDRVFRSFRLTADEITLLKREVEH